MISLFTILETGVWLWEETGDKLSNVKSDSLPVVVVLQLMYLQVVLKKGKSSIRQRQIREVSMW